MVLKAASRARMRKTALHDAPDAPKDQSGNAGVLDQTLVETGRSRSFSTASSSERIAGIVIGYLEEVTGSVQMIDYPQNPLRQPLSAISTVAVTAHDVGRQVALAFEEGDPQRPIILGLIYQTQLPDEPGELDASEDSGTNLEVRLDGERITLNAEKEIVLRSGKASITLTRAGKILIRGAYLLSRSSGVNRIKGGSVQIN